jgi:hypothetical protein
VAARTSGGARGGARELGFEWGSRGGREGQNGIGQCKFTPGEYGHKTWNLPGVRTDPMTSGAARIIPGEFRVLFADDKLRLGPTS